MPSATRATRKCEETFVYPIRLGWHLHPSDLCILLEYKARQLRSSFHGILTEDDVLMSLLLPMRLECQHMLPLPLGLGTRSLSPCDSRRTLNLRIVKRRPNFSQAS